MIVRVYDMSVVSQWWMRYSVLLQGEMYCDMAECALTAYVMTVNPSRVCNSVFYSFIRGCVITCCGHDSYAIRRTGRTL